MKSCNYSAPASSKLPQQNTSINSVNRSGCELSNSPSWLEQKILSKLAPRLEKTSGQLLLTLPSGYSQHFRGSPGGHAEVTINSLRALARLVTGGINGWSEGYIAGEWDSPDLTALVRWALQNETILEGMASAGFITRTLHTLYHRRNHNSRSGSKKNISAHYDLGNDFYNLWLDPTMTYSAAWFDSPEQPLEAAQRNKYQRILELLEPAEGDHLVEIGCGWGGFAEQALQHQSLRVHGITLSEEQLNWSRQRLNEAGLDKRSNISLTDYRDLLNRYDGVVSIEMFEAVGEAYWDTYFETLKRSLKTGGKAVLQVISIEDERFEQYRKQADFIQRYIFPGGMLPSVAKLEQKFAEHGFELQQKLMFGKDYAHTLRYWRKLFEAQTDKLDELGYDERFRRLWRYYLCYCEGGFDEGSIDVGLYQLVNRNP